MALSADGGAALVGAYGRSSSTGAAYVFTNAPALSATGGTPQSATVGQPFAAPLTVALTDSYGTPLVGVTVTFTAPAGGAERHVWRRGDRDGGHGCEWLRHRPHVHGKYRGR